MIEFHNNLKLYHFQTKRYGSHKASDQLYTQLVALIDHFFEVYQGKHHKLPPIHGTIHVATIKDKAFATYTRNVMIMIETATRKSCKLRENSDLCNILDEIRAALAQFVYLLTFK
jgi:hypothetical protein